MSCEVCLYGAYSNCPCCSDDGEYSCGGEGRRSGCEGCDDCLKEATRSRIVTAAAPRSEAGRARRACNGIKPGDRIRVTVGFEYQVNGGPRMGYFRKEMLVARK